MLKRALYSLALLSFLTLAGCGPKPPTNSTSMSVKLTDYGNGVYVMRFTKNFPNDLAAFIAAHPNRRGTAMYSASETDTHGATWTVAIVTEPR